MLTELRIRDLAIIDNLELTFEPGFVVLTGETGAGKSIIIDAVELLLGGRGESTLVRSGMDSAMVEGTFLLSGLRGEEVLRTLDEHGLKDDTRYLTLGREIRREGRNICRINGRTVSLAQLRELGEQLVDVHGQSEHLSLLRVREHLHLLDRFAGTETPREQYHQVYLQLSQVQEELARLRKEERQAERQAEMLAFQINEIEAAALVPGETSALQDEQVRLANAEKLTTLVMKAISALDEGQQAGLSASELMGETVEALEGLARVDQSLEALRLDGQVVLEQVLDLAGRLRVYRDQIEFNPARLDEVEERLGHIRALERKYGNGIEAIMAHAETSRQELEKITHAEERLQQLTEQERGLRQSLADLGAQLSQARSQAAEQLANSVEKELADLRMAGARFGTELSWKDDPRGVSIGERRVAYGPYGVDQIEFLVEPNPGEGLKPLVKIASGGETSRLMLGLKSVLARADRTPTLIFDEIDQGIGGRVGAIVGRKLWALARSHQVLCVTHLPQLAAFGDQHFKVEKQVESGRTVTLTHSLSQEEHPLELAQMLGSVSEANLQSAADLLARAKEEKTALATG